MNSVVDRIRTAADAAARAPLHQPDLFERATWMIEEIATASAKVAAELVNLSVARSQRDIDMFERANAEISQLLRQSTTMIAVLTEQIETHKAGAAQ